MGPPIYIGGNYLGARSRTTGPSASMGPPIYIGGNSPGGAPASCTGLTCFNGATDLYRWKPPLAPAPAPRIDCFNGATDLYRWKQEKILAAKAALEALQWGHRFISVETCPYPTGNRGHSEASMGPPIYIGGNSKNSTKNGSNITPLQWGHRFISVETKVEMGHFMPIIWLQWGHRFISVETANYCALMSLFVTASMGPPIYIGGNSSWVRNTAT